MQVNSNAVFSTQRAKPYDHGALPNSNDYGSKRRKEASKWAKIWFGKLCRFHRKPVDPSWRFSQDQVIAFLKSRVQNKDPAWKRLKMAEGLVLFQADC